MDHNRSAGPPVARVYAISTLLLRILTSIQGLRIVTRQIFARIWSSAPPERLNRLNQVDEGPYILGSPGPCLFVLC